MSEYTKKRKLINDNKDIYISEYDKNLSYDALSKIVEAKKDFVTAAKNNDKVGMTKANAAANTIRADYGSYTGGLDGSEYNPFDSYDDEFDDFESKYDTELDKLYSDIIDYENSFQYNHEKDPVYQAYKKLYEQQGNLAYDRALAENSLKTGGVENTHAQSAAMQALNYYNSRLAEKIPELYEAAYQRHYKDSENKYNRLKDAYNTIRQRDDNDYQRYLDRTATEKYLKDFDYRLHEDAKDRVAAIEKEHISNEYIDRRNEKDNENEIAKILLNNQFKKDEAEKDRTSEIEKERINSENENREFLYKILRDAIADEKWQAKYNQDALKNSLPQYQGDIGKNELLEYAQSLFEDEELTTEDLQRLLGL